MHYGTCCALKLHAISQFNRKIICGANTSLASPHSCECVREAYAGQRRLAALSACISGRISVVFHFAAGIR